MDRIPIGSPTRFEIAAWILTAGALLLVLELHLLPALLSGLLVYELVLIVSRRLRICAWDTNGARWLPSLC